MRSPNQRQLKLTILWTILVVSNANGDGVQSKSPIARLEIQEFMDCPVRRNLFLRALQEMQYMNRTASKSFYAIAGIHGYPNEPYDGIMPREGMAGFCEHRSLLFPIWHRPYMLLFEKALIEAAAVAVARYDESIRPKYETGLAKLRLPFWDWARHVEIPEIFKAELVVVERFFGGKEQIKNPLHSYMFQETVPVEDTWGVPQMDEEKCTVRHNGDMEKWQSSFDEHHQAIRDTWCSTLQVNTFEMLSIAARNESNAASCEKDDQLFTMERAHDLVHVITGGHGGHMAYVESAAFDPIFFLHHANIDRLLYLWQISHPSAQWMPNGKKVLQDGNRNISMNTNLLPFNTSPEKMKSIQALGYTYAEEELVTSGLSPSEISKNLSKSYRCKPPGRKMVYAKVIARLDGFGSVRIVVSVLRNSEPRRRAIAVSNPVFLSSTSPEHTSRTVHAVDITDAIRAKGFTIPDDINLDLTATSTFR